MKNEKLNLCKNCRAVYTPLLFCARCSYYDENLEIQNIKYKIKLEKELKEKTFHPLNIELIKYPLKVWKEFQMDKKEKDHLKYLIRRTKQLLKRDGYLSGRKSK